MIDLIRKDGDLILDIKLDDKCLEYIKKEIKKNFLDSKSLYYRNFLSITYEKLLNDSKILKNNLAIILDKFKISLVISYLEDLFCKIQIINKKVVIIAYSKKKYTNRKIHYKKNRINDFRKNKFKI